MPPLKRSLLHVKAEVPGEQKEQNQSYSDSLPLGRFLRNFENRKSRLKILLVFIRFGGLCSDYDL